LIPDQGTKILKATWYGQKKKKKNTKKSKIHCTFAEKKKKKQGEGTGSTRDGGDARILEQVAKEGVIIFF